MVFCAAGIRSKCILNKRLAQKESAEWESEIGGQHIFSYAVEIISAYPVLSNEEFYMFEAFEALIISMLSCVKLAYMIQQLWLKSSSFRDSFLVNWPCYGWLPAGISYMWYHVVRVRVRQVRTLSPSHSTQNMH